MSKSAMLLSGIGSGPFWAVAGVLVFLGRALATLAAEREPQPQAATGKAIHGSYSFVSETSGTKPAAGAEIVLKFVPPNVVTLRAVRPRETLTDIGTFEATADQISITLPELGKTANKAKYKLASNQLTLPLLILGDGQGTSTWTKINSQPDPLNDAVGRFYAKVNQQGRAPALENLVRELRQDASVSKVSVSSNGLVLVTYRSGYREFFLAPAKSTAPPRQGRSGEQGRLPAKEDLRASARSPRRLCAPALKVQFLPGGRGPLNLNRASRFDAWLAREPEPISRGDAPAKKTALLLSAFHTLPVLIPKGDGLKYNTFAEAGENLDEMAGYLKSSGYSVEGPYIDAAVSVGKLFELTHKRSWGVLYFNTHGGILNEETQEALLSTGEEVPIRSRASPQDREKYVEECLKSCRDYLRKAAPGKAGDAAYERLKKSVVVGWIYDDIPFIAITSEFFEAAEADFSSGLVFINGCDSARSTRLREALHARSFMGWAGEVAMELAAEVNGPFWRCLSRKTRSDREAMDFALNYLLEAKKFDEKMKTYGTTWDPRKLAVYRQGKTEPEKPLVAAQRTMLMTVREYAFRRKGQPRGEDLPELVSQLYRCNEENKGTGLGPDPFCRDALIGAKVPTAVIDEVKGELCGFGGRPARFTLIEK